jgi:predicted component of type VI protein secretion system
MGSDAMELAELFAKINELMPEARSMLHDMVDTLQRMNAANNAGRNRVEKIVVDEFDKAVKKYSAHLEADLDLRINKYLDAAAKTIGDNCLRQVENHLIERMKKITFATINQEAVVVKRVPDAFKKPSRDC